jgi:hypothetical protein
MSLQIVKGNNGSKATVGVISLRVHCHTLNGPTVDLWLLVCVHTTCGCYENFKSANTHCGCHLTERWRASSRHDWVASVVRVTGCETHTHAHTRAHCALCGIIVQQWLTAFVTGGFKSKQLLLYININQNNWHYFLSRKCLFFFSPVSSQIAQFPLNQFAN